MRLIICLLCLSLFANSAPAPRADYHVAWAKEKFGKDVYISQDDFRLMCHTVYLEAGNQSKECMRLVAIVILNRICHDRFPDKMTEVIYQRDPVQFTVTEKDGFPDAYPIPDDVEEACYMALATYPEEPTSLLFFRSKYYHSGLINYKPVGNMYFSLKEY